MQVVCEVGGITVTLATRELSLGARSTVGPPTGHGSGAARCGPTRRARLRCIVIGHRVTSFVTRLVHRARTLRLV